MPEFQLPPPTSSKDFTNLISDMFNELYETSSFKLFGKNGHKQKGFDIISSEKKIVIQCKAKDLTRKPILVKKELFTDIEETLSLILNEKPKIEFDSLYIVTTFSEHPDFDEYCQTIKDERKIPFVIVFWGWENIQQKLIGLPKTLANHYSHFIISNTSREHKLVSKLELKKKIEEDFADWLDYQPENRKRRSRMIMHSIDDTKYPEHEKNKEGHYQWFRVEMKSRSHKGVEFTTGINYIYVDKNGNWTDLPPKHLEGFQRVKAEKVSMVAYEDIVYYDLRGDEHYICPHFFCKFRHNGTPFIEEYFLTLDNKELPYYFDQSTKKEFE